jgi:hypothetical protein
VSVRLQRALNLLVGKLGDGPPAPQSKSIAGSPRTSSGEPARFGLVKYSPFHAPGETSVWMVLYASRAAASPIPSKYSITITWSPAPSATSACHSVDDCATK